MKKKYLVLTVLGAIICILRIGGNVLVSKITGGEVVIKSNLIMAVSYTHLDVYKRQLLYRLKFLATIEKHSNHFGNEHYILLPVADCVGTVT